MSLFDVSHSKIFIEYNFREFFFNGLISSLLWFLVKLVSVIVIYASYVSYSAPARGC